MTALALQLAVFLLPLIVQGLQEWAKTRNGGNADVNIQRYRQALAKGNSDNLALLHADQHDRVLEALRGRKR